MLVDEAMDVGSTETNQIGNGIRLGGLSAKLEALRVQRLAFESALQRVESIAKQSAVGPLPSPTAVVPANFFAAALATDTTGENPTELTDEAQLPIRDDATPHALSTPQAVPSSSGYATARADVQPPALQDQPIPALSPDPSAAATPPPKASNAEPDASLSTPAPVREEAAATTLEEGLGKHKPGRLPDPDEERTQETLIAARQALWQQNFMRIQRWLQSESITMEGETNRAYARAAGDLEDGQ